MKEIIHILKYKLLLVFRLERKLNISEIIKNILGSIIYIGFALGTYHFTKYLISLSLNQFKIGLFLLHEFLSIVLFIFFLSVNIGNIIVSYSTLYKSNEITFLITKPIKPINIFLIKFLDNIFYSSTTLVLILVSAFYGYANYFKMNLHEVIILFIFNFFPFIISAGSLGVIILLIILKLASKYELRKIIFITTFFYLFLTFIFFKIQSPISLVNTIMKFYPFENRNKYFTEIIPPIFQYLPNHWLTDSAYWIINNNLQKALPKILYQIVLSLFLFIITLKLGKKYYLTTFYNLSKFKKQNSLLHELQKLLFNFSKNTFNNSITESIVKRDLLLFVREPSQNMHLILLFTLVVIFTLSINNLHYVGYGNYLLQTIIYLSIMLFNFLLISTVSLRFIFPLLSLEGQAFWKIKSAPVSSKQLIIKKLIPHSIIIFLLSTILNIVINFRYDFSIVISTVIYTFFSTLALITINFGMGGLFANYKEKNPIRLASSKGASISFLLNILFILINISLLIIPFTDFFMSQKIGKEFLYSKLLFPLLLNILLSVTVTAFFYKAAYNSIRKDFV